MYKVIDYMDLTDNDVLIDVRSPGEYSTYTIPGAINIPLFDDGERKEIGTVYNHESTDKAKQLGITYASKRLPDLYQQVAQLKSQHERIIVFCERGGMRSSAVCSLFDSLGLNIIKLKGGYKGYRESVNQWLPELNNQVKYVVLHGYTGVGKTELLDQLQAWHFDVLDLEKAANHRGSLLGDVGLNDKISQKQFEATLFKNLRGRKSDIVFIEAESSRIGNIVIPKYIMNQMKRGYHILIDVDLPVRIDRIVKEYTKAHNFKTEIIEALQKLEKYIGKSNAQRYIQLIEEEKFEEVARELMLKHYDPLYSKEQKNYHYDLVINADTVKEACSQISEWLGAKGENQQNLLV